MRPKSHLAVCLRLLRCGCGVNTGRRSTLERIQQAKPQSLAGRAYSLPESCPLAMSGERSEKRPPSASHTWPYVGDGEPRCGVEQDPLLRYNTLSVVEGFRWSQSLINVLG